MSSELDFADAPRCRYRQPSRPSWLGTFSAVLAANVLAAVIVLLGIRYYVIWSIADTLSKFDKPAPAKVAK